MTPVSSSSLRSFVRLALTVCGAAPPDASNVATGLLWADLRGRHPQGVARLPKLAEALGSRRIKSPAALRWTTLAGALHRLDAGQAFGQVAGHAAMQRAIFLAHAHGVGAVVVCRSNHYGAASWYCAQAAEAGCIGITCTNAAAKVAPFGASRAVFGTNPLAFGCPTRSGAPILVDLSTSMMAGSNRREMEERGESLPPGVALDRDGRPTTDPAAVRDGCLLPAAGAKGFGLALMVEILSAVLSGAAFGQATGSIYEESSSPADNGHFFLAIDLARTMPAAKFLDRLDELLGQIHDARPLDGGESVRFPGEIRARLAQRHEAAGIALPEATIVALERLAGRLGLQPPWAAGVTAGEENRCPS